MLRDLVTCQIALGGNVGDVRSTFAKALRLIVDRDLQVVAVSRLFETPPMGVAAGGTFLNAAATIETTLEPQAVLDRLLATEDALGRVRNVHWGPRAIDLDLVLCGERVVETPRLRLPHPGLWYRRFVLDPLVDVAADSRHPETGEAIVTLRDRLLARPLKVAITGEEDATDRLREMLARDFAAVAFIESGDEPALRFVLGSDFTSAVKRSIGVAPNDHGIDLAQAVLTATLGVPEPVGHFW